MYGGGEREVKKKERPEVGEEGMEGEQEEKGGWGNKGRMKSRWQGETVEQ